MNSRRQRQGGYTLVETIVAVTVGAIVMTAIFPIFLLLYRVETTWGNATQARASGLIAEESLVRDLRAYHVDRLDPLVLSSLATDGPTYQIEYSVDLATLIRTVTQGDNTLSKVIVAHGIEQLTATCSLDGTAIELQISTTGTGGTPVRLDPDLVVTPRNPQVCP